MTVTLVLVVWIVLACVVAPALGALIAAGNPD